MKNSFIAMSITPIMFAACSNNQTKALDHQEGAHQHEDGTTHKDYEENEQPKQEHFKVSDSINKSVDTNQQHTHNGHDHTYKH